MSEILDVGFAMPASWVAVLGCLQPGRLYLFSGAMIEKRESPELAFAAEVSTWKTLA